MITEPMYGHPELPYAINALVACAAAAEIVGRLDWPDLTPDESAENAVALANLADGLDISLTETYEDCAAYLVTVVEELTR